MKYAADTPLVETSARAGKYSNGTELVPDVPFSERAKTAWVSAVTGATALAAHLREKRRVREEKKQQQDAQSTPAATQTSAPSHPRRTARRGLGRIAGRAWSGLVALMAWSTVIALIALLVAGLAGAVYAVYGPHNIIYRTGELSTQPPFGLERVTPWTATALNEIPPGTQLLVRSGGVEQPGFPGSLLSPVAVDPWVVQVSYSDSPTTIVGTCISGGCEQGDDVYIHYTSIIGAAK